MTVEEFKKQFENERHYIICETVEQRGAVLQFLVDIGYVLGPETVKTIPGGTHEFVDTTWMNPGYSSTYSYNVSNFDHSVLGKPSFRFDEVAPLIRGEEEEFDTTDFSADLSALFS